ASNGRDAIAELLCELDSKVTEAADSLNRNQIARQRAAMPKRVKRGNPGTHQRRGDRKSTRLNSSHGSSSYAVFCLKKQTSSQDACYDYCDYYNHCENID